LAELNEMIREAEQSDNAALQLLARPRTFFIERGFFVPLRAKILLIPTEELRMRLLTESGLAEFLATEQSSETTISIHVKTGIAKCTKVKIK
jgi:hypothetical protein